MADSATSDWGSSGGSWTGGYGQQQPYGGWGGGMQQPYGQYGMQYGGGYGMQNPWYGGYGMQQQQYQTMQAPQQAQTLARTQVALTPNAPTPNALTPNALTPNAPPPTQSRLSLPSWLDDLLGQLNNNPNAIGGNTKTTFTPWEPLGGQYQNLWGGKLIDENDPSKGFYYTGANQELKKQQDLGPLGFDPNSEAALQRIQQLSQQYNPLISSAVGATSGIASGNQGINTGNAYWNMMQNPGINNAGQYQDMYRNTGITGINQYQNMANSNAIDNAADYRQMIGQDAIGNQWQYQDIYGNNIAPGQFNELYNQPGIDTGGYYGLAGQAGNAIGTRRMEDIYGSARIGGENYQNLYQGSQGRGSLDRGMFGNIASGDLVGANPHREKALRDAMKQTGNQVKASMSARGRYGSDAYGEAMGEALGRVSTEARMKGYDTDTANMMAAAQARSGEGLARQGIGLQAAAGLAGTQGQNIQNRLASAQSIMGAQGQNWQNQLAAMQGLTGAQAQRSQAQLGAARGAFDVAAQNRQNQLAAAQGISNLQGQNAQQRLAQIQGLSGIQGQNYQSQLGALGQMNQAQQAIAAQRMAAAQGLTGVQGQNWQNQMAALQGLTGVQGQNLQNRLQAAGMAGDMNNLRYDDANRLLQAGATREAMAQQQRNFGWEQLAQQRGMLGNLPGSAGNQTQSSSQPWWQSMLGAGMAGLGGLGSIFG